ncbi:hypothetical protein GBF35_07740 [Nonomuraea phyllanthi]|uniref:cytochrome c oxidase assembly protein n=1 Tax=Nonomuraea phyllanthi TaxID=2219224 RepID=UPI00129387BB|nr:cytochrome c oxidase assembly protein [Nonomuraea phyllanthi]QFY06591.1 hypothetical protein GBF35_07740 [Nonomuraea phyllanthi]
MRVIALHHPEGGLDLVGVLPVCCWLLLAAAGYVAGLRRLGGSRTSNRSRTSSGSLGRGDSRRGGGCRETGGYVRVGARRMGRARVWAFAGGLAAVAVALLPPLDAVADDRFSTHMAQHMILISLAGPLLAAGAPGVPVLLLLPPRGRRALTAVRRVVRRVLMLRRPVTCWAAHVAVLWVWHLPVPYGLALSNDVVHVVEHVTFLGTAWLLWAHVLTPARHRLNPPLAILYLFATALPSAALGAVLTLARAPLFPGQAANALESGADPLADQQLAGLIMWIPADLVYLGAIFAIFLAWMDGPREGRQLTRPPAEVASPVPGGER